MGLAARTVTLGFAILAFAGYTSEALAASSSALAPPQERCAALADKMRSAWPDHSTQVADVRLVPEGTTVPSPFGPPSAALPEHCLLTASMQQRTGIDGQSYAIRFNMRLPSTWNGRFFFQGGGGTNGDIGSAIGQIAADVTPALTQGYAVVSQDSGHDNKTNTVPSKGGAAAFGFDPKARADYGGASLKPVADAAKAVISVYYGKAPSRSYFVGCSKGGEEGMVFAQRYPAVFDGIVAADPGFSLPRAALAEIWDIQAFAAIASPGAKSFDPRLLPGSVSPEAFGLVRKAVLETCDADDGARDGMTAAVGTCTWARVEPELKKLECPASQSQNAGCIPAAVITAIDRVYHGATDRTGKPLYSDWPLDGGIGSDDWRMWKIGPASAMFPGINVMMGAPSLAEIFATPPTALPGDPQSALQYALNFDFDRDAAKIYATDGTFKQSGWTDVSARSPDLSGFRSHGGKMIVPHGASDPVFSLNDTLAWYREVDGLNHGKASSFVRVFPVPGMAHCAGGPSTDRFDAFSALVAWVEQGKAPERIEASAGKNTPWPGRSRPLCPYPKVAKYKGSGSLEDGANFSCE